MIGRNGQTRTILQFEGDLTYNSPFWSLQLMNHVVTDHWGLFDTEEQTSKGKTLPFRGSAVLWEEKYGL